MGEVGVDGDVGYVGRGKDIGKLKTFRERKGRGTTRVQRKFFLHILNKDML
jgi:hypothetical protein